MRTFRLLNVVKVVDTEAKAKRLEMLGYEEVTEATENAEPEQKKKAPVKKTTKGE